MEINVTAARQAARRGVMLSPVTVLTPLASLPQGHLALRAEALILE